MKSAGLPRPSTGDTSWLLAIVGTTLLGVGVYGYFTERDANVTIALITAGFLFVYSSKIVDRSEGQTKVGLTGIETTLARRVRESVRAGESEVTESETFDHPPDSASSMSANDLDGAGAETVILSPSARRSLQHLPPNLALALGRRVMTSLAEPEFQAAIPGEANLPPAYQSARFGDVIVIYRHLTTLEASGSGASESGYFVLGILSGLDAT
ncbi:hypothetical protein PDTK01_30820 [Phycicoccus sp. DTK01]|nr:hypothetical protein PDTK01_30820 [Phycicoccus sp. DTK01]